MCLPMTVNSDKTRYLTVIKMMLSWVVIWENKFNKLTLLLYDCKNFKHFPKIGRFKPITTSFFILFWTFILIYYLFTLFTTIMNGVITGFLQKIYWNDCCYRHGRFRSYNNPLYYFVLKNINLFTNYKVYISSNIFTVSSKSLAWVELRSFCLSSLACGKFILLR